MAKRGQRRVRAVIGDPNDPEGLYVHMKRYLMWMRSQNYSERTVENRESYLSFFITWCHDRSIATPHEVTKPILERYQRHLFHLRKANGQALSSRSQFSRLVPVRAFFKHLTRKNILLYNPASELDLPRLEKRLPKHVLSKAEAEQILSLPDLGEVLGLRDKAILETFYATGMRRMELANLHVFDLDGDRGTVMIRQGKGKKDRMIPISARAIAWIEKYRDEARPKLAIEPDEGILFLNELGESITVNRLTQLVRNYVRGAELGKSGSCHLFRHTMATLMLEHGADIRYIQQMLGHADISTTQIYTQVSIRQLQTVYALTHPGAKLGRREQSENDVSGKTDEDIEEVLLCDLEREREEDDEGEPS
jgi:integrase/recombinase XerD